MLVRDEDGLLGGGCGVMNIHVEDDSIGQFFSCDGVGCEWCRGRFVCYTSDKQFWLDRDKIRQSPASDRWIVGYELEKYLWNN